MDEDNMMTYGNKKKRYDGLAQGINSRKPGIRALRFDILFFLAVLFISCFGVLIVYSATRNSMPGGVVDPAYYLKRQSIFLGVGMVLFAGFHGLLPAWAYYRLLQSFYSDMKSMAPKAG